ncbi:S1 RNA binding domain 1, partial [Cichlidogyrus casuarinus]
KRLEEVVNSIVEECISFVGLDLNLAPLHMLYRVAGLTMRRAQSIIDYREQNNGFHSRHELLKVSRSGHLLFLGSWNRAKDVCSMCWFFAGSSCSSGNEKADKVCFFLIRTLSSQNAPLSLDETVCNLRPSLVVASTPHAQAPGCSKNIYDDDVVMLDTTEEVTLCHTPGAKHALEKMDCTPAVSTKRQCLGLEDDDIIMIDDTCDPIDLCDESSEESVHLSEEDLAFNPLDQTAVHPQTYLVTKSIILAMHWHLTDVGSPAFVDRFQRLKEESNLDVFLSRFVTNDVGLPTLRDIVDYLSRPLEFDERQNLFEPLFHENILDADKIKPGTKVVGRVKNVTTFGAFVECGLSNDVFIHLNDFPHQSRKELQRANMNARNQALFNSLHFGDRIEGTVKLVKVVGSGSKKHFNINLHKVRKISPDEKFH